MHLGDECPAQSSIRVGGISYLNSKPLLWKLEEEARRRGIGVVLSTDVPSELARKLAVGMLDVGLISSVEFFRSSRYRVVSDACVSSFGPVRSVKVLGRVAPKDVRVLALDAGSRSSAVLARILFAELAGTTPATRTFPLGAALEEIHADAVLIIGDRAMRPTSGGFAFEWDLGATWKDLTGLPFVFALWIASEEAATGELAALLSTVRDGGVEHLDELAEAAAGTLGFNADFCRKYLREHIRFHLGDFEKAGLRKFREFTEKHGLL